MSENDNKGRREFLKKASFAALSASFFPSILKPASPDSPVSAEALACDKTTLDYYGQGPFYTANAPAIQGGLLAPLTETGSRVLITGRIFNLDCTQILPNTVLDIWHANNSGAYDNTGFSLRGKTVANSQGFYTFETILPGKYLNGSQYRPSHIHFKITPPGSPTLTTQLYFQGDIDIPIDAAASITSGIYDATARIIPLTLISGKYEGTWDIVVSGTGITGLSPEIHLERGMIYECFPNPVTDEVNIRFGVFQASEVTLYVFGSDGKTIAEMKQGKLSPEKYEVKWRPASGLSSGIYFIVLQINDLQVHYVKLLK